MWYEKYVGLNFYINGESTIFLGAYKCGNKNEYVFDNEETRFYMDYRKTKQILDVMKEVK